LFAVGHFALGYILSKTSAKALKTQLNIPTVLTLSIIPDIDLLIPFLEHRGLTHSIVIASIVFVPVFAICHKRAAPYFIALIQHSLVGDYLAGGKTQLLFPISTQYYGTGLSIQSQTNLALEWAVFLASMLIMVAVKDINVFFQPHNSNLILALPMFTVLLPTMLTFPIQVPPALIPPHVAYLILFVTSISIEVKSIVARKRNSTNQIAKDERRCDFASHYSSNHACSNTLGLAPGDSYSQGPEGGFSI
jgi:membrane-bound metal-dependent hydrolase YbcI (DUF457 family)